jgi:hypothetical protein
MLSRRTLGVATAMPLALTLALVLTGCGSGDSSGEVASANGAGKSGGTSAGPKLSPEEMGLKFAQCLREHGIDVDDPEPGKGARITVKGTDKATVDQAMQACRKYDPAQNGGGKPDAKAQESARKHAQCMREHGVEEFPDPQPEGGIRIDRSVGEDPDFAEAEQACNEYLGGGGMLGGEQG